ncbi:heat shock 70 kDa protein 16 [Coffea eugenioides]|uniref:heat shock 70 kDa protein 16 n=1 Tax=Coffea eugenioides TaxID=49369 RepID=UPI000F60D40D|nr:heat shock 70 kDa protein 16 [Coffea eugenioides]
MSVLGLDVGNENCVVAVAKQRGIDVLLNDESKRETPAVVSFGEKQRFMGAVGAASATMNLRSTISQVKRLIGRKFREPSVQDDLKLVPFETSEGPDGGILIHLHYLDEKQSFTPFQIMVMLFGHLKQISEKNLETHVSDCVIGIPSYFTDLQRRAYLHAAEIAGLKPLRLMHDCTATALGYGIYKTDFNGGPANVVFVDVGHCDTQVAVASFQPGQMKILSHAFDSNLGGRDFDEVLFRYFAANFKEQYNIDVHSNLRASIRLRAACEKLKKVLSANPEAPLNIECLMDEKDVKGFIKREDFEKLSSHLLERISFPCRKALLDSGLTLEKIHTVELVGSGSRIPAIMKVLSALFRREPSRTINVSECVARGCALQCAMLSPTFRVREFEVQDSFPFSIGFSLSDGPICAQSNCVLFPRGHPFPSVKMLTLQKSNTFQMEAFYANENELLPCTSTKISDFLIGPYQVSHSEKAKVKVRVHLNIHGIVGVESASLIEDHADDPTSNNYADALSENMETSNHETFYTANGPGDSNSAHSKFSPAAAGDERRAKATRRQDIPISENICGGMTPVELSQAQEKELQLAEQDTKMERTKDHKNSLESYVYDTRNKLLNSYRSFATDAEREGISSSLQQTEEWLYDDGDDESEHVYTRKLEDLKKMVNPVEHRYKDEEARAQATRSLLNCIVENRMAVGSLPPSERDAVYNECSKAEQWLRERTQLQDSLPKNADPTLSSSEIRRRTEALDVMCKRIMRSKSSLPTPHDAPNSD